jgi:hypothetical protein
MSPLSREPLSTRRQVIGLLSEDELCGSFSAYAQETEDNSEVQKYLKDKSNFFSGLPKLFQKVDNSTNENCKR